MSKQFTIIETTDFSTAHMYRNNRRAALRKARQLNRRLGAAFRAAGMAYSIRIK